MSHLKRLRAPRTWNLSRKAGTFITRPSPGPHPLRRSLPLLVILRDVLGKVQSAREGKKILRAKGILIDGAAAHDLRQPIGLFDVVSIPSLNEYYRLLFDGKGRLQLVSIPSEEQAVKVCRIMRKQVIRGGKIQVTLHDGRTLLTDNAPNVGDSVVLALPGGTLTKVLKLMPNTPLYVVEGKRRGSQGAMQQFKGARVMNEDAQHRVIETLKEYVMAVGETKPLVTITGEITNETKRSEKSDAED